MAGLDNDVEIDVPDVDDTKIDVTIIVTDADDEKKELAKITVKKQVADKSILLKTLGEALYTDTMIVSKNEDPEKRRINPYILNHDFKYDLNGKITEDYKRKFSDTVYTLKVNFPFHIVNDIQYILNAVFSHLRYHLDHGYEPINKPLPSHDFTLSGADSRDIDFIEGNAYAYEPAAGPSPGAAAAADAAAEELRKDKDNFLMDIAFVARRLDIPPLLELAGAKIASIIKYEVSQALTLRGQADRLRRRFGIPDKFPKTEPERTIAMKEAEQEFKSPQKPAAALPAASREVPIVADPRNYVVEELPGTTEKQKKELNVQTAKNSAAAASPPAAAAAAVPPNARRRVAASGDTPPAAVASRGAAWDPNEDEQKGGRKVRK